MSKALYKILFHLENEIIDIVEIKRNGIMSDDVSIVYHWLLYDKVNDTLNKLDFETMKSTNDKEYRVFDDSKLSFDKKSGIYETKGKKQTLVLTNPETPLSEILRESINDYLLMLTFRGK